MKRHLLASVSGTALLAYEQMLGWFRQQVMTANLAAFHRTKGRAPAEGVVDQLWAEVRGADLRECREALAMLNAIGGFPTVAAARQ